MPEIPFDRRARAGGRCWSCSACSSLPARSCCGTGASRGAAARASGRGGDRVGPASAPRLFVNVVGAVRRPGLYTAEGWFARRGRGHSRRRADPEGADRVAQLRRADRGRRADRRAATRARRSRAAAGAAGGTAATGPVHLNSATLEQLDALPGVGPVTAQKILDYRQQHGAFGSVDELDAIAGIGPARLGTLRDLVAP